LFDRHEQGGMTVYPLLVKPCPWQEVSWLARLQVRPRDARALASFRGAKVDEVLVEVAREISSMARNQAKETPASSVGEAKELAKRPEISGEWEAVVTYDWPNAKYSETFSFKVEGNNVFGSASFLGVRRTVRNGNLSGDRLTFVTKSQERLGSTSEPRETRHHYRGRVLKNEIQFVMQTDGGHSEHSPVEFTARRKPAG